MRIETVTKFIADDGKEFDNEVECREYEEQIAVEEGKPRWIVSDQGELGVRVLGINYFYYKDNPPMPSQAKWRFANKREFGEVVRAKLLSDDIQIEIDENNRSRNDEDINAIEDRVLKKWQEQFDWKEPSVVLPAVVRAT